MLHISLPKGTVARGVAADGENIYYTTAGSSSLHKLDDKGSHTECAISAPEHIGGIDLWNNTFLCGSYSAAHTNLYRIAKDGTLLDTVDYLKNIPPLYLPIEPYTRYVTGVTMGRHNTYWISLQNSKFIYNITQNGAYVAVRQVPLKEDGNPIDLAGICSDDNTMYMSDFSDSKIYCLNMTFGGVKRIPLPDKFEPFGVHWQNDKLYVISANFTHPEILIL